MRCAAEPNRSLPWSRMALFAGISVIAVSCSSESSRFNENPFYPSARSASRQAAPGDVTGSVSSRPASKPTAISSQPLPPPPTAGYQIQTRPAEVATTPTSGGSRGLASYNPPPPSARDVTGSVPSKPVAAAQGWNWEGGTPVVVGSGETAHTLSQRYGVPVAAIVQANGLPDAAAVKPGQHLVIPRYEATGSTQSRAVATQPAQPKPAPQIAPPATTSSAQHVHVIAPGETLMKLSRQYKKTLTEIARANNLAPHTQVKVGDRIVIPGVRGQQPQQLASVVPPMPAPTAQRPAQTPQQVQPPWPPAPQSVATQPAPTARVLTPANDNPAPEKAKGDTTSSLPGFRWPVRGRVVAAFGPKPNGQQNDGINVAVPEGTPIKAAEDGVVAYAGNELKTYGNLVLIRHSNGYVTAYAHASEILVKRDEPIKRGQVIAKSGQTGNVSAPQLHFEIRKGSSPVDPMPYLDKGGST
jgi:murein DD-endopeptidase MepM/ murein hydrolase activator NlpD